MSRSTVFGLQSGKLTLAPNFTKSCDDKGKWTASASFWCIAGDDKTIGIQQRLASGTSIVDMVNPGDISEEWSFLTVDTFQIIDRPGGISQIDVEFKGYTEDQFEFDSDRTKVYQRSTSMREDSILNWKTFKDEVTSALDVEAIRQGIAGTVVQRGDSTPTDIKIMSATEGNKILHNISGVNPIKWWNFIVQKGNHTYEYPVTEWTMSTTGKNPLTAAQLENMGFIDTPPGNPGTPTGRNWRLTGATENIQVTGDSVNSYSLTWSMSGIEPWPDETYAKPA